MQKTGIPVSEEKNVTCLPDGNLRVVLACYENDSLELHQPKDKIELAFSAAQMLSLHSAEHKTSFLSRSVPFNPLLFSQDIETKHSVWDWREIFNST